VIAVGTCVTARPRIDPKVGRRRAAQAAGENDAAALGCRWARISTSGPVIESKRLRAFAAGHAPNPLEPGFSVAIALRPQPPAPPTGGFLVLAEIRDEEIGASGYRPSDAKIAAGHHYAATGKRFDSTYGFLSMIGLGRQRIARARRRLVRLGNGGRGTAAFRSRVMKSFLARLNPRSRRPRSPPF
jgi:hypothetical protein